MNRELMLQCYDKQLTIYKDVKSKQIESNSLVKHERIKASTLYDRQRTYEARFFGFVLFVCGSSLAYQTWYTTEYLTGFLHQFITSLSNPFLPFWRQYLLDETPMLYGWLAKGVNTFVHLLLLIGVAMKKLLLVLLFSVLNIASTGSVGASSVVLITTITISIVFMKLYLSDVSVGSPLLWMSVTNGKKKK
jgi:hypothetical protein